MKTKNINEFTCLTCKDSKPMEHKKFMEHLKEVHSITDKEGMKGKREMKMHMDGDKFFSSTYEWTLEKSQIKFMQYCYNTRTKETQYW